MTNPYIRTQPNYPIGINIDQLTILLNGGAVGANVAPSLPVISIIDDGTSLTIQFTVAVSATGVTALNGYFTTALPATTTNPQTALYPNSLAAFGTTCNIETLQSVNRTYTVPDVPDDTFTLNNATQTLTNKTCIDTGSNLAANSLKTTSGVVTVASAALPSTGQALIATSPTTAAWSAIPGGNFGSDFVQATGTSTVSTTNTSSVTPTVFVFNTGSVMNNYLTVTLANAGTYLLSASIVWWFGSSATTQNANFQIRQGSAVVATLPTIVMQLQASTPSSVTRRYSSSPYAILALAAGTYYFGLYGYTSVNTASVNMLATTGGIAGTTLMFYRVA